MPRIVSAIVLVLALSLSAFAKKNPHPAAANATQGDKWAVKTLRTLSVEEKIGQVFMIWCRASFLNVENPEYLQWLEAMRKYHVGSFAMSVHVDGPFLLRTEPYEAAELLNRLQKESKLPLLFAADFERGVTTRLMGTTNFPHAMAFGADGRLEDAEMFGRITAQEARAVGVHWNFFPDADVNSNPANPIINTRSFGEDPKQVGDLVTAYIKGAHEGGMLTTVKHFPGHGDTATDSHLGVASVNVDRAHLDSIELPPFRQAIAAGVDSVMVAHVTVPALDPDPNHVATISAAVVTDLLEKQLGFKGLIVTDALDMAGLTHLFANDIGRAAVEAFKAGNDLLIIPADFPDSYESMLKAVRSGEISKERLDHSVLKILKLKGGLGLNKSRTVDLTTIATAVGKPENIAFGQQVANSAITLVRDNGKVLPLKSKGTTKAGLPYMTKEETHNQVVAVLFSDDVRTESGRAFGREFRARIPDARVIYVDPRVAAGNERRCAEGRRRGANRGRRSLRDTDGGQGGELGGDGRRYRHAAAASARSCGSEDGGGRYGESVPGQRFSEDRELHVYIFQCDRVGSSGDQGALRGDSDSRSFAGQHSECCSARRRTRTPGPGCQRRVSKCAALNLKPSAYSLWASQLLRRYSCLRAAST